MSKPKDNTTPDNPDFSALHDDSRTEVFNRPRRRGHGMPPQQPAQQVAPAPVEESSGLSSGLTKVLGAAALIVAIASLVVAISTVVFVTKKHDDPDLAALLAAANYNNSAQQRLGSSHSHRSQSSKPGASNHGGSATTAGAPAAPPVNAAPNNPAPAAPAAAAPAAAAPATDDQQDNQADDEQGGDNTQAEASAGPEMVNGVLTLRMDNPTVDDFSKQFEYLINPAIPDAGIQANIDAGAATIPAGRLLQKSVELNRANNWQWHFHGPVTINGNSASVFFVNSANGWPETEKEIVFTRVNGSWKYSRATVCSYLAASGTAQKCM